MNDACTDDVDDYDELLYYDVLLFLISDWTIEGC